MKSFYQVQHPEIFQGSLTYHGYFEGWYHKIVSRKGKHILAIIPGVALDKNDQHSHAFIQILNGKTAEYFYIKYPISQFYFEPSHYFIRIEKNYFSSQKIKLDVQNKEIQLKGAISYHQRTPLPYKGISPGIMGWFSYVPFMQTNHGIVSMNHDLSGQLLYNSTNFSFHEGKGYIEKDWGRSFPSHWIWMQSNHFSESQRSFMFSLAQIPFLGSKFIGFLGILYNRGKMLRFGTYTGAKCQIIKLSKKEVKILITSGKILILVDANKGKEAAKSSALMKAPQSGMMTGKCIETISATIKITVFEFCHKKQSNESKQGWKKKYTDIGEYAGLEIMGNQSDFKSLF